MRVEWNNGKTALTPVPKTLAGKLKLASGPAVKVLLWIACAGGEWDSEACCAACGIPPESCEEALAYWVQEGVLTVREPPRPKSGEPETLPGGANPAPKAQTNRPAPKPPTVRAPETSETPGAAGAAETPGAAKASGADPQNGAGEETRESGQGAVIRFMEQDTTFGALLSEASVQRGRLLSPSDMELYLYLYRDLKLPAEVILLGIGWAVENGKNNSRYIEKMLLGWAQDGINTVAKADSRLCRLEHTARAVKKVQELCPWMPPLTAAQKDHAYTWLYEWKLPESVIAAAGQYVNEKEVRSKPNYLHRLLEHMAHDGVDSEQAAKDFLYPPRKAGKTPPGGDSAPSFDIDKYEADIRHRPRIK